MYDLLPWREGEIYHIKAGIYSLIVKVTENPRVGDTYMNTLILADMTDNTGYDPEYYKNMIGERHDFNMRSYKAVAKLTEEEANAYLL